MVRIDKMDHWIAPQSKRQKMRLDEVSYLMASIWIDRSFKEKNKE